MTDFAPMIVPNDSTSSLRRPPPFRDIIQSSLIRSGLPHPRRPTLSLRIPMPDPAMPTLPERIGRAIRKQAVILILAMELVGTVGLSFRQRVN